FPTDEELLGNWTKSIERTRVTPMVRFGPSIERGDQPCRPAYLLGRWLPHSPSFTRFKAAALALRNRSTGRDFRIHWGQRVDAPPREVEAIMPDVEFAVMRRFLD